MNTPEISRRELLRQGGAVVIGLTLPQSSLLAQAFPRRAGEEVIPFLDQPQPPSPELNLLNWAELDSWITPNQKFFRVVHYNKPVGPAINAQDWRLEVAGLVQRPLIFTLSELKARPRQEVIFTLECSGNRPQLSHGVIGNARWAGTPLAPILQEAGVLNQGIEVVFFGSDEGEEEVRELKVKQNFARSMALADAMNPNNLLCYEMNGAPLPQPNGFPLRLIVPGWYGIASFKWLKRIEVRDTRYMGRFMAREYVTLREDTHNGETVWMETSVGRALLKSVPSKVTRKNGQYRIVGAAWGAPIQQVEVQIDGEPWRQATIDRSEEAEFAWKIWSLDWDKPSAGAHTIVSRAIDTMGNIQPAMDDPRIAKKFTRWESNGQFTRLIRLT
jgi:DMSO/TMAO reductase YedYZ molybdopterin-dependent catalytic subunit